MYWFHVINFEIWTSDGCLRLRPLKQTVPLNNGNSDPQIHVYDLQRTAWIDWRGIRRCSGSVERRQEEPGEYFLHSSKRSSEPDYCDAGTAAAGLNGEKMKNVRPGAHWKRSRGKGRVLTISYVLLYYEPSRVIGQKNKPKKGAIWLGDSFDVTLF